MLTSTTEVAGRKKRVVVSHQTIVDYCVLHPKDDSERIARYFGIHRRTAQKHMKTLQRFVE